MPGIICKERKDSGRMAVGEDRLVETKWDVFKRRGDDASPMDRYAAELALLNASSFTVPDPDYGDALYRFEWDLEPIDSHLSLGLVRYHRLEPIDNVPPPVDGLGELSFEVFADSQHIQQSLETIETQSTGAGGYPFDGAINVDPSTCTIHGTDILTPRLQFREAHTFPLAMITPAWIRMISGVVGKVNLGTFRTFETGEIMLVGLQGAPNYVKKTLKVNYVFDASPNRTNIVIGGVPAISQKRGHDYLWATYVVSDDFLPQAVQANVERVYHYTNYAVLGIGS